MKKTGLFLFLIMTLSLGFAQVKKDTSVYKKAGVSVEFALNTCFGGGSNNAGNREISNFAYGSVSSQEGVVDTINYKLGGGLAADFGMNLMFGKKRSVGFSIGAMIIAGFNSFSMDSFEVQYKAFDKEGRSFRRIQHSSEWKEKVTYTSISLPVLFKYRYYGKKRLGLFADIGPVVTVFSNAKSQVETVLDFEAVYSMSGGMPHYSEQTEKTDWVITREMVGKHLSADGSYATANEYFDAQYTNGYYVGLDKRKSGKALTVDYKIGFGGLLRAGMIYKVTRVFSITLGGQCLIVSSGRKNSADYKPVDVPDDFENGGNVNSILNSAGSLLKAQYGINIGLNLKVVK